MEAVIAAVYLDGGWDAADDLVHAAARRRASAPAPSGPGGHDYKTRLQELAAREFDQLPRYQVRSEGPDHSKQFFATVTFRGEVHGERRGSVEEAGRAGRGARRVGPPRRGSRATATLGRGNGAPGIEGAGCRSCLRSRSCAATSNARSSASGSRRSRSTGCARVRRHHNRKQFISRLEGKKFTGVDRRGQVPPVPARRRRRARRAPRDVGPAAAGEERRARRARSTPTSSSPSSRAVSSASSTRGRSARCS